MRSGVERLAGLRPTEKVSRFRGLNPGLNRLSCHMVFSIKPAPISRTSEAALRDHQRGTQPVLTARGAAAAFLQRGA